jgi:hypothetical protein
MGVAGRAELRDLAVIQPQGTGVVIPVRWHGQRISDEYTKARIVDSILTIYISHYRFLRRLLALLVEPG